MKIKNNNAAQPREPATPGGFLTAEEVRRLDMGLMLYGAAAVRMTSENGEMKVEVIDRPDLFGRD